MLRTVLDIMLGPWHITGWESKRDTRVYVWQQIGPWLYQHLGLDTYLLNEFQACGQKHGGEREHLFWEMKGIWYGLSVKYMLRRNKRLGWRSKQGVDQRRPSLVSALSWGTARRFEGTGHSFMSLSCKMLGVFFYQLLFLWAIKNKSKG